MYNTNSDIWIVCLILDSAHFQAANRWVDDTVKWDHTFADD